MLIFFSICILFVVFVIYVLTRKTEAQQWVILKFAGLFFLMAFMMISESYRVDHGEKLETQAREIKDLQVQINQIGKHRHNLSGRVRQ